MQDYCLIYDQGHKVRCVALFFVDLRYDDCIPCICTVCTCLHIMHEFIACLSIVICMISLSRQFCCAFFLLGSFIILWAFWHFYLQVQQCEDRKRQMGEGM